VHLAYLHASLLDISDVEKEADEDGGDEGEDAGDAAEFGEDAVGARCAQFLRELSHYVFGVQIAVLDQRLISVSWCSKRLESSMPVIRI